MFLKIITRFVTKVTNAQITKYVMAAVAVQSRKKIPFNLVMKVLKISNVIVVKFTEKAHQNCSWRQK